MKYTTYNSIQYKEENLSLKFTVLNIFEVTEF